MHFPHITYSSDTENYHQGTLRNRAGLVIGVSSQEEQCTQGHLLNIHADKEMGHGLGEEAASGVAVMSKDNCKKQKEP